MLENLEAFIRGFYQMDDVRTAIVRYKSINSSLIFVKNPKPVGFREINLCISDESYNGIYRPAVKRKSKVRYSEQEQARNSKSTSISGASLLSIQGEEFNKYENTLDDYSDVLFQRFLNSRYDSDRFIGVKSFGCFNHFSTLEGAYRFIHFKANLNQMEDLIPKLRENLVKIKKYGKRIKK